MKSTTNYTPALRKCRYLLLAVLPIVMCFCFGSAKPYDGLEKKSEDSSANALQALIDSIYPHISEYADAASRKKDDELRLDKLKQENSELLDRLKAIDDYSMDSICSKSASKETAKSAKDWLKARYREMTKLEIQKENIDKEMADADDSIEFANKRLKRLEKSFSQSKAALVNATSNLQAAGRIRIKSQNYRYFIVKANAFTVRIHNNDNENGPQTFANVTKDLKKLKLDPAMITNGGMYTPEYKPQGLLVENFNEVNKLDTSKSGSTEGLNFYLQPNGVFYIDTTGFHIETTDYYRRRKPASKVKYATQSGPMLLSNGLKNPNFKNASANLNIRSGVGLIARDKIVFIISDDRVNFFDFASIFEYVFNCGNALYLDGAISKMRLNQKLSDLGNSPDNDGAFGPVISVTRNQK